MIAATVKRKLRVILKRMDKKTLVLLIAALGLVVLTIKIVLFPQKYSLTSPNANQETEVNIEPSKSLKTYTDPAGFTFSYPDNLSLVKKEADNPNTYADISLSAKDTDGSLSLNISDSKFSSLESWVTSTQTGQIPKDVMLGNLKALEIQTEDKLQMAALDQGVLFNIEVLFGGNKDFWVKVYGSVIKDFSFAQPVDSTASGGSGGDSISFEGEEAVE